MLGQRNKRKPNYRIVAMATCIMAGFIAIYSVAYNIGERYYLKKNPEDPNKPVFLVTYENEPNYRDEIIIYDAMHRMANSKIPDEDKDKSGNLKITEKQIQAVRTIVKQMNYPDNSYILAVLARWEKEDFSLVTDEHDYFWSRLKE
jgi:hypothetical protein